MLAGRLLGLIALDLGLSLQILGWPVELQTPYLRKPWIYSNINLLGSLIMIFKGVVNRSLGSRRKTRRQLWWLGFWTNLMTSWSNCQTPTRVMNLWQTFDNLWHVAPSVSLPLQTFGTGTPRCWWCTSAGLLRWCFSNCSWNVHWFSTNVQTVEIRCVVWTWHD